MGGGGGVGGPRAVMATTCNPRSRRHRGGEAADRDSERGRKRVGGPQRFISNDLVGCTSQGSYSTKQGNHSANHGSYSTRQGSYNTRSYSPDQASYSRPQGSYSAIGHGSYQLSASPNSGYLGHRGSPSHVTLLPASHDPQEVRRRLSYTISGKYSYWVDQGLVRPTKQGCS